MRRAPLPLLSLLALSLPAAAWAARIPQASAPQGDAVHEAEAPAAPGGAARAAAPASGSAALLRALDTIEAAEIRADLEFIASDELAGRDTPSDGLRLAARFLRARLARLGFQPAGDDGGFFHLYELERYRLDLGASSATIERGDERHELAPGADYSFFGTGAVDAAGPVVSVGAGTEEDVAGLDLTGKWALTMYEARDEEAGEGRRRRRSRRSSGAEDAVRARGAIGLIVAEDPERGDGRLTESAPELVRRIADRSVLRPAGPLFPTLYLTMDAARKLFGGTPPARGQELGVRFHERRALRDHESFVLENVAGLWPGTDLAEEVIVVSAHYDHEGVRGEEIYNGADDNGSGTCGLLALAEALKEYGPMRRSVLLLWVSGEEKGLLGSAAWTKEPSLPQGHRAVLNLNIDMIGRNEPDKLLITPTSVHPAYNALTRMAESNAPLEGFPGLGSADDYWTRSDHMNFSVNLGIPVAFLFSDVHEDYHRPTDTADKIDYDKIRRVTRLVVRMLDGLQTDSLDL